MRSTFCAGVVAAAALATACTTNPPMTPTPADPDPYLWLEEVGGERPLAWARERNAASEGELTGRADFNTTRDEVFQILNSRERIPYVQRAGGMVYNLWTDEANKRGLLRRTTLDDYRSARPRWEPVLDIDKLGEAEHVSWVWGGMNCVPARSEAEEDRCILGLSRGGSDAKVFREFDLKRKAFVEGGFALPEAKSELAWIDRDHVYVGTDFGPGSLTKSGYPRVFKRWERGTPLAHAATVFEAREDDVSAGVSIDHSPGFGTHVFSRAVDFFRSEDFVLRDGQLARIDKPELAVLHLQRNLMLLELRSPYTAAGTTYPAGAVIATQFDAFLRGERKFDVLFAPTPTRSLARRGISLTRTRVLLNIQENVVGAVDELWREGGAWHRRSVTPPGTGTLWTQALEHDALDNDPLAEAYWMGYADFLTPDSLFLARTGSDERALVKQRPQFFDAAGMRVEQAFATSKDGTRVPYFVVWPRGARADGANPTLLYGYGGFQISMTPSYPAAMGRTWMQRGGVFVVANIRGGGEFGPDWHRAALKEHKQRSYDDFIAVAEDLIARRITTPARLGIQGGSNGGLLVGAVMTQRPELFAAVVCQVPLLDMRRYSKLLAGASWMAEYGNPDRADEWSYIGAYSPYQQLKAGVRYPRALFTTSTRDDRVHPGHARKMVARMMEQGHDVLYYENIEGGHGGAADAQQRAHLLALEISYLWMQLGPAAAR
jgi:prolyl oligopeptidase